MAALEAAARDRDENTPSPETGGGAQKGKLDSIKEEDDIKKEIDDGENSHMDSSGGKNVNNETMNIKSEIKSESMDVDPTGNNESSGMIKEEVKIKDEPMSPSQSGDQKIIKTEVKPVVPEPIQPNALDKKKKCCKFQILYLYYICL